MKDRELPPWKMFVSKVIAEIDILNLIWSEEEFRIFSVKFGEYFT